MQRYVTVEGEVHVYNHTYKRSELEKKPRCPLNIHRKKFSRSTVLKKGRVQKNGRDITLGYYCEECKALFLTDSMKVFKGF